MAAKQIAAISKGAAAISKGAPSKADAISSQKSQDITLAKTNLRQLNMQRYTDIRDMVVRDLLQPLIDGVTLFNNVYKEEAKTYTKYTTKVAISDIKTENVVCGVAYGKNVEMLQECMALFLDTLNPKTVTTINVQELVYKNSIPADTVAVTGNAIVGARPVYFGVEFITDLLKKLILVVNANARKDVNDESDSSNEDVITIHKLLGLIATNDPLYINLIKLYSHTILPLHILIKIIISQLKVNQKIITDLQSDAGRFANVFTPLVDYLADSMNKAIKVEEDLKSLGKSKKFVNVFSEVSQLITRINDIYDGARDMYYEMFENCMDAFKDAIANAKFVSTNTQHSSGAIVKRIAYTVRKRNDAELERQNVLASQVVKHRESTAKTHDQELANKTSTNLIHDKHAEIITPANDYKRVSSVSGAWISKIEWSENNDIVTVELKDGSKFKLTNPHRELFGNFTNDDKIRIKKVEWDMTSKKVIFTPRKYDSDGNIVHSEFSTNSRSFDIGKNIGV